MGLLSGLFGGTPSVPRWMYQFKREQEKEAKRAVIEEEQLAEQEEIKRRRYLSRYQNMGGGGRLGLMYQQNQKGVTQ